MVIPRCWCILVIVMYKIEKCAMASTISQFWSLKTVVIVSHEVQDNFDMNTVLGNVFQEMMMQY